MLLVNSFRDLRPKYEAVRKAFNYTFVMSKFVTIKCTIGIPDSASKFNALQIPHSNTIGHADTNTNNGAISAPIGATVNMPVDLSEFNTVNEPKLSTHCHPKLSTHVISVVCTL